MVKLIGTENYLSELRFKNLVDCQSFFYHELHHFSNQLTLHTELNLEESGITLLKYSPMKQPMMINLLPAISLILIPIISVLIVIAYFNVVCSKW